jgi:hypothetical protein
VLTYWGEADAPKQFDKAVAGLISNSALLGDKKSIEWVDTHYPDKPDC